MEFVVIAHDYKDADALNRRMSVRTQHIALIRELKEKGHVLVGGATLNDTEQMNGSIIVVSFESEAALKQQWLDREPYLSNQVWEQVQIVPYKVASLGQPLYEKLAAELPTPPTAPVT